MKFSYAIEPIPAGPEPRSQRERQAVSRLIRSFAGEDACIDHTSEGAPFIPCSDLHISITHSRHYAAVAWSDFPGIGIDIEESRPDQLQAVASRVLTDAELRFYSDRPDGLLQAWTLKEAAFKALQNGPADLRSYHLPLSDDQDSDIISVGKRKIKILISEAIDREIRAFLSIVAIIA